MKSHIDPYIIEIIEKLQHSGFETYVVGGAVRDFMLGRQPKDYDISTSATPEKIREIFGRGRAHIIGRRFRLVHLYHGGDIVEVSTFRKTPSSGTVSPKLPPVTLKKKFPEKMLFDDNEFGTAEEDVWRRDFTANAVFYDPVHDKFIDFTGQGMEDIKNKTVRAIGDPGIRFQEDPVRILRALKLVGQYGFKINDDTEIALLASIDLINLASGSRLTLELEKILKNPYSHDIFRAFHKYGFLSHYLPFLDKHWNTDMCKYSMHLLKERNKRITEGAYRESVSLGMSVIALPFIEREFGGKNSGDLWDNFPGVENLIWKYLVEIFHPHRFTRRIINSSRCTILMQPKLMKFDFSRRLLNNPAYQHARELFKIQNEAQWKNDKLADKWPEYSPDRKKRNGKHHYR